MNSFRYNRDNLRVKYILDFWICRWDNPDSGQGNLRATTDHLRFCEQFPFPPCTLEMSAKFKLWIPLETIQIPSRVMFIQCSEFVTGTALSMAKGAHGRRRIMWTIRISFNVFENFRWIQRIDSFRYHSNNWNRELCSGFLNFSIGDFCLRLRDLVDDDGSPSCQIPFSSSVFESFASEMEGWIHLDTIPKNF